MGGSLPLLGGGGGRGGDNKQIGGVGGQPQPNDGLIQAGEGGHAALIFVKSQHITINNYA